MHSVAVQVLRESMRLLPVTAVGMNRVTTAPITNLGGYAVPANTNVLVRTLKLMPCHMGFPGVNYKRQPGNTRHSELLGDK